MDRRGRARTHLRTRASVCLLIALAGAPGTASAQGPTSGTAAARTRGTPSGTAALARELLAGLVAVNTTLSEGATTPAAELLAARFRTAGFPAADVMVIGPNAKQ